jgi:glycosyltransferase involved in cell wall biosynthesis
VSTAVPGIAPVVAQTFSPPFAVESRHLNVLTLTPFYPSEQDPTQGRFVSEPIGEIAQRGVTNEVIAAQPFYRGQASLVQSETRSSWKQYFSLPGNVGLPLAGEFLAAALRRQIRQIHSVRSFDLIHAHAALPCGRAAQLLSRSLGIPFIVSVHGLDAFSATQAGPGIGRLCARISKRVYSSAHTVICISEKVRQRVNDVAQARTTVVYNGVDTFQFRQGPESKSPLVVLSVGNLIPIKGHAHLLGAFAGAIRDVPECVLEIIGDGPERQNLVRLTNELGISSCVRFRGRQSREVVTSAMQRCAVFALPSSYEGLGCVYLEAMACGKPAIGCHGQGIDEIIQHGVNGLLVSSGSEAELTYSLATLLSNEELRQHMGMAAHRTVVAQHTLTHQAAQLMDIYRECVR